MNEKQKEPVSGPTGLLGIIKEAGKIHVLLTMVDNLADRLRMEMTAGGTVCATPCLIGAWTRELESY